MPSPAADVPDTLHPMAVHDACRTHGAPHIYGLRWGDASPMRMLTLPTPTERSDIEFTNTRRGLRQDSGSASLSRCSVTPNPAPSGPSA
jgi:hypothetical protein